MEKMNDKLSGQMSKLAALPIAAGLVIVLIFSVVTMAYPAAMIAIGAKYLDSCPANRFIPLWLLVSGSASIFALLLIVLLFLLGICGVLGKEKGAILAICPGICAIVLLVLVSMFGFAWFIAGNVWVFSLKSTVDFNNILSPSFCNETLYQFAFWSIIVTYIMMGLSCLCSCCSCVCSCLTSCCKE